MKPYKRITLISYLIVAFFFSFCSQDPYSKEKSEKRRERNKRNQYTTAIAIAPYIRFPAYAQCRVDCPYYNTNLNEFPFGDYSLTVNGSNSIIGYPKTISSTLLNGTVTLSTAISEKNNFQNKCYSSSDSSTSNSNCNYAEKVSSEIKSQVYDKGKNTFLKYDGDKQVEIYVDSIYTVANPTTPINIANSEIYLKLTNLSTSELNTALTLNSTNTSRYFEITFQGLRYSSKYSGSTLSLTLASVPTVSNTALLTITSGTLKSSNTSSLESISISGTMTAYRQ